MGIIRGIFGDGDDLTSILPTGNETNTQANATNGNGYGQAAAGNGQSGNGFPSGFTVVQPVAAVNLPKEQKTAWDAVTEFCRQDFEKIGFDDAWQTDEIAYRDKRLLGIIGDYISLLHGAVNYYEDLMIEMESEMDIRAKQGAFESVERLKGRLKMCQKRLDRAVAELEQAENNGGRIPYIRAKYESGFARGLTALTEANYITPPLP